MNDRPPPSATSLASLLAAIWAADTFDEVAEATAEAIVGAGSVSAARVRLWHADTHEQAVAAVGVWPSGDQDAPRRLARLFARKSEPDERPLLDKSGHPLGVLTIHTAPDAAPSEHDIEVSEILATQAGLAAAYIRLLQRYQRLERRHAAQRDELHTAQRTWKISLDEAPVGMCTIGLRSPDRGTVLQVNDALCDILGSEPHALIGSQLEDFIHTPDRQAVMGAVRRAADGRRTPATRQARLVPLGDQPCRSRVTITPVFDRDRNPLFAICHIQRSETNDGPATELAADASDAHFLSEKIQLAVKRADRYGAAAALLLCDLSDLTLADGIDEKQRQQLLTTMAEHLRGVVRADDLVGAVDAHTMGVLLDELDATQAETVAKRVQKQLVEVVSQFGGLAEPSVGVTLIEGGSDPHRVLKDASAAMRRARSSPSRVVLYERAATAGASPSRPALTTTRVIRNRARRRRPRPPL